MATITFKNGSEYLVKLNALQHGLREDVIGRAVYAGADIVADEIKRQLEALPTDEKWGTREDKAKGPKAYQKEGLIRSLGITPMKENNGIYNVKIGFDGYNGISTKRWPKGQPNQMVARAVERGTTYMEGHEPIKKAVAKARKPAQEALEKTVDEEIQKIMEGK